MQEQSTMANDYTEDEKARMSPEELASIDLELNDEGASQFIDDADAATANAEKSAADDRAVFDAQVAADAAFALTEEGRAAQAAADAEALVVANEEAARAAADAAAVMAAPTVDTTPFVPVFKAPLITDEDHAAAQAVLAEQFESGDLTTPQFQVENDRLTRAKLQSDMAVQGREQAEDQTWGWQQDQYFQQPGHAVLRDDPRIWAMMQADLELQYQDPANARKSNVQFLTDAGNAVKVMLGIGVPVVAPAAVAVKPAQLAAVPIPKTLEGVPTAEANAEDANGEFAHMTKLEGMAYEMAYARMPKDQQDRFLAI